jgi:hypothetical protein
MRGLFSMTRSSGPRLTRRARHQCRKRSRPLLPQCGQSASSTCAEPSNAGPCQRHTLHTTPVAGSGSGTQGGTSGSGPGGEAGPAAASGPSSFRPTRRICALRLTMTSVA